MMEMGLRSGQRHVGRKGSYSKDSSVEPTLIDTRPLRAKYLAMNDLHESKNWKNWIYDLDWSVFVVNILLLLSVHLVAS